MQVGRIGRRALLLGGSAGAATLLGRAVGGIAVTPALAQDASPAAADAAASAAAAPEAAAGTLSARVVARAKELSEAAFERPTLDVPQPFNALNEAAFRAIRGRDTARLWRGEGRDFEVDLLPRGWIYDTPVSISTVDAGKPNKLKADQTVFDLGKEFPGAEPAAPYAFSGFRILSPIHDAARLTDTAVFQGASYFRAIGRNQVFGTFVRALALNTARAEGEEFPVFREFWIETPDSAAESVVIHAIFDSPSLAGAARYVVRPGATTEIDVTTTLFPRRDIAHFGIAPLTSMFYHGPASTRPSSDIRPRVHNADGLGIVTGRNERIWRPLANHRTLQVSAFMDENPRGFGLAQRPRAFADYQDFDAAYERRPTVWVTPRGDWGRGGVELVEIPTNDEIHDNIVAYWRPAAPLEAGKPATFRYRLSFSADEPVAWMPLRTVATRVGSRPDLKGLAVAIEFQSDETVGPAGLPVAEISNYGGKLSMPVVRALPDGKISVSFDIDPADAELIEVRLVLRQANKPVSESWVYRWTKP